MLLPPPPALSLLPSLQMLKVIPTYLVAVLIVWLPALEGGKGALPTSVSQVPITEAALWYLLCTVLLNEAK